MDDGDQGGWGKQEEALRPHCQSLVTVSLVVVLFACLLLCRVVAVLCRCVVCSSVSCR